MLSFRTDDPLSDYDRYEAECEAWLKSRPVCVKCREHIQDQYAYLTENGWICDDCADESCTNENREEVE